MDVLCTSLGGSSFYARDVGCTAQLRRLVAAREGAPAESIRLMYNGRVLHDAAPPCEFDAGVPVRVLLTLLGGKGGFGAMLRTAGARGVKTTNFDACRDLNGRRLRHVNAEAALREWEAAAEERKLKKQQERAMKAKPGPKPVARFDDDEYEEMLEGTRSRVSDAIAAGLAAASSSAGASSSDDAADGASPVQGAASAGAGAGGEGKAAGKRKVDEAPAPSKAQKTTALWADPLAALGGEGSDESSDEEGSGA